MGLTTTPQFVIIKKNERGTKTMRTTIITCTDGTKIAINWYGTVEEISRFVFEWYGKTVEKICRGF